MAKALMAQEREFIQNVNDNGIVGPPVGT